MVVLEVVVLVALAERLVAEQEVANSCTSSETLLGLRG